MPVVFAVRPGNPVLSDSPKYPNVETFEDLVLRGKDL